MKLSHFAEISLRSVFNKMTHSGAGKDTPLIQRSDFILHRQLFTDN